MSECLLNTSFFLTPIRIRGSSKSKKHIISIKIKCITNFIFIETNYFIFFIYLHLKDSYPDLIETLCFFLTFRETMNSNL
jgi:hypothetical protein